MSKQTIIVHARKPKAKQRKAKISPAPIAQVVVAKGPRSYGWKRLVKTWKGKE